MISGINKQPKEANVGLIKTVSYQGANFDLDMLSLPDYAQDWQTVLSHPDVRLLKPEVKERKDVLIVEKPEIVQAVSAYGLIISISWSINNPDFTEESRTIALSDLKKRLGEVAWSYIATTYFPHFLGHSLRSSEGNGVNVWLQRLDASFVLVPDQKG